MNSDKSKSPRHAAPSGREGFRDPWSLPIAVAQIPSTGLHRLLEASPEECRRLAELAGVGSVADLRAEFTLHPGRGETVRIEGRVSGKVGQTCVVSLEPLDCVIDETVDLVFAPPEQVARLAALADETEDSAERPDPPEPIENGMIDLGRIASDALFLGIDPYPRRPGARLDLPPEIVDPEDHPFAALKAFKPAGGPSGQ